MKGEIAGKNFVEMEAMKYWSYPAAQAAKQKTEVYNYIMSGDYIGALKVDGYYQRVVKDDEGNCFMIARNRNVKGEVVNKIDWMPQIQNWLNSLPNGTCLLCECYWPGNEGSKNITSILGCLKDKAIARQKEHPLHLYVFDCIAYGSENLMDAPYEDRIKFVNILKKIYADPCVDYAEYYSGKELWDKLQDYLSSGREGAVIMKRDAIVYEKRTPARVSIKVKKELHQTIDCVIIGTNPPLKEYTGKDIDSWTYWIDAKTGENLPEGEHYNKYYNGAAIIPVTKTYYNKWPGSFKLGLWDGENAKYIGDVSGLTDEMKQNHENYIGKVVEVGAMEIMDTGGLRHPKILCIREDKKPIECTLDQLEIA